MYPEAICVSLSTCGVPPLGMFRSMRVTVPLRTSETNTWAVLPMSLRARSHGPSSRAGPVSWVRNLPLLSRTISEPCWATPLASVGTLPTSTKPLLSTPSAVVRPVCWPGMPLKNTDFPPSG
jgi:hypothetical protein